MNRYIFPALIVLATAGTVVAMTRDAPSEDEASVKLPVAASQANEITPWILAAATDLGHKAVRAYDGSVFIKVGDDSIAYYKEKNTMQMRVAFDSKYRHARAERDPALKALESKGETIYEHALSLQARAAAKEQIASRGSSSPEG